MLPHSSVARQICLLEWACKLVQLRVPAHLSHLHVVRNVGHAFEASRHHDVALSKHDLLGGEHHRLHPRRAHLLQGAKNTEMLGVGVGWLVGWSKGGVGELISQPAVPNNSAAAAAAAA